MGVTSVLTGNMDVKQLESRLCLFLMLRLVIMVPRSLKTGI